MTFSRVPFSQLKSRQQENYNFQKVAALPADYGFNCLRLPDDRQGADFIACHIDGQTFLEVQLKGRLCLDKEYVGKSIHVAFARGNDCFVYPHDELLALLRGNWALNEQSERWRDHGQRHWRQPPVWAVAFLAAYQL